MLAFYALYVSRDRFVGFNFAPFYVGAFRRAAGYGNDGVDGGFELAPLYSDSPFDDDSTNRTWQGLLDVEEAQNFLPNSFPYQLFATVVRGKRSGYF